MFGQLIDGMILVVLTVAVHSAALAFSLRELNPDRAARTGSYLVVMWLLSRLAIIVIVAHLIEIWLWALYFLWVGVMKDMSTSFYFSAVTYATLATAISFHRRNGACLPQWKV